MNETEAVCPPSIVACEKEWRPSKTELLKEYRVQIEFLSIGCVIHVGCKSIPFPTVSEGMKALNEYIDNPFDTRKIWEERFAKEQ